MRIHSITLTNFRGVEHSSVSFSRGVTVVEGPNEVGKSSLIEALSLIRTEKATSKKGRVRAVRPVHRDVGPEVELHLTVGGKELRYRKRWLRSPLTELEFLSPVRENLAGDTAHDRFTQLLDEEVDLDLLHALELMQGASLTQPQLAQVSSLHRALDSATAPQTHDALMEVVGSEYEKYYTAAQGRPTGEYNRVLNEVVPLREEVQSLELRSRQIDRLTEEHGRAQEDLARSVEALREAEKVLAGAEAERRALDELVRAVDDAERMVHESADRRDTALSAREQRSRHVTQVGERERAVEAAHEALATLQDTHTSLAEEAASLEAAGVQATDAVQAARQRARTARASLETARWRRELEDLSTRLHRAREADDRRARAAAEVSAAAVDEAAVRTLVEMETDARLAERALAAAAAQVAVSALGDHEVRVGDSVVGPGEQNEQAVTSALSVVVDGIVEVSVRPATPPEELRSDAEETRERLTAELERLEVSSVAEAQDVASQRARAEERLRAAMSALESALLGKSLEGLAAEVEELTVRLRDEDPAGGTVTELVEALKTAEADEEEADEALVSLRSTMERAQNRTREAHEAWVRADQEADSARRELHTATQWLEEARREQPDDALSSAVDEADAHLRDAEETAAHHRARLDAAQPEQVQMQLDNARALVQRYRDERAAGRSDLDRLAGALDERASEGVYDALVRARSELEAAEGVLARLERRARAVDILRRTLVAHRDRAQERYVAPLKEEIERLGRIVFGSSFEVELTPDLLVASRSLEGVTVPFESLSSGAREQVALIGRLAAARLVAPEQGAPLILDDTLGFADPERLQAMGAVFTHVGNTAQVIILTCQPDRYRSLGGATLVRLARTSRPEVSGTDSEVAPSDSPTATLEPS